MIINQWQGTEICLNFNYTERIANLLPDCELDVGSANDTTIDQIQGILEQNQDDACLKGPGYIKRKPNPNLAIAAEALSGLLLTKLYPGKVTDRCPEDFPFLGDGSFIVAQYGYDIENYTRNCIALAGLAIGWRVLAYLYLCFRFRPSNR